MPSTSSEPLAANPNAHVRDPDQAVRLAERASRLRQRDDVSVLDTLAAAYAAADQFDRAVVAARAALSALPAGARQSQLAASIQRRLELYIQRRPYRGVR